MTPNEFKAWFDGFTEAFSGVPTKAQWARIKERVSEIDGKPVTERVFIDRYYPSHPPRYWWSGQTWTLYGASSGTSASTTSALNDQYQQAFNATSAMNVLGRADAKALAS